MPKLHPEAIKLVARLVEQGRAREKPFGIPLQVWLAGMEKQNQKEKGGEDGKDKCTRG